jgi:hypothetical protein
LGIGEFERACAAPLKTTRKILNYRPCGAGNPARSRLSGGQSRLKSRLRPRLAAPQLGFHHHGDPQVGNLPHKSTIGALPQNG